MTFKKTTALLIRALALSVLMGTATSYAEEVTIVGSIKHTLKQSAPFKSKDVASSSENKEIQLLQIELSDSTKVLLANRAQSAQVPVSTFSTTSSQSLDLPKKIQLGMNKVPVLDQGIHGTCVVFALTGAIDAVLGKGDYVSQICHLQLGNYLEKHGYGVSGWNGSWAINVIQQIEQFGIVNRSQQRSKGCGGVYSYPVNNKYNSASFIEPDAFRSMSELIFGKLVNWTEVADYSTEPEKKLNDVKQVLQSGDRLVFAVMLPRVDLGTAGAVGKYKTWIYKDSWVLTPEILKGVDKIDSAHEMIITGYDDNAVAVDNHGVKHRGLLILRNSWSESVGNYGEFYMSYDYFKLLAYDMKRFSKN